MRRLLPQLRDVFLLVVAGRDGGDGGGGLGFRAALGTIWVKAADFLVFCGVKGCQVVGCHGFCLTLLGRSDV